MSTSAKSKREYYPARFRLDNVQRHLLWFRTNQDDDPEWTPDMVHLDDSGKAPYFNALASLESFCLEKGIDLIDEGEPRLLNLDVVAYWLKSKKSKRARHVRPVEFLDAWSLFDDVSHSVNDQSGWDTLFMQHVYDKLFFGNNLPSITPEGYYYVPQWSGAELRILHDTFSAGLRLFRNSIKKP